MRFRGSSLITDKGVSAIRIRNKPNLLCLFDSISLQSLGDPRYYELWLGHDGNVWIRKPVGRRTRLAAPHSLGDAPC